MYFRIIRQKNKDGQAREYLCLVKSYRDEHDKVRQKLIANLGRLDELKASGNLGRLADKLNKLAERRAWVDLTRDIKAPWSKHYGIIQVLKGMWKRLKISEILLKEDAVSNKEYSLNEAIQAMVMNRLVHPASKLETWRWKDRVWEPAWEGLNLQHLYRAMDYLVERKDEIEKVLFEKRGDLFGKQLDLVLFDTTTIKYWGEASDSELLKHGHSKEKRMDLRQIIVGVLMSKEGMPLAHEVWEGNQSDIVSLKKVLRTLQEKYDIRKVVLVCDRGMVSKKNLEAVEQAGYEYIVGVKMRQFDETTKRNLLGIAGFEEVREDLWVKDQKVEGRRYLVCYNPQEAEFEAKKREYFKQIIRKKVMDYSFKDWIVKNGYRKYVKIEGKDWQITMDEERLEEEKIYDGKWVLVTNTEFTSRECALYYKSLSQVEQGFRDLKSEIETGPIYHWTTRRIRSHVFICFLALLLKVAFEKALMAVDPKAVYSEVIQALKDVKASKFQVKAREIILRTNLPEKAHLGFKAAGMRIPGDILYLQEEPVVTTSVQNDVTLCK